MSVQHNYMRSANALSILHYIRTHGESTRREIQKATGLSWAAVSTISADLIAQDILVEKALEERVSGRNPNLLDFNSRRNLTIGAEINVEGLSVVLVNLRGEVVDAQEELLEKPEKHAVLNQLTRMIEEVLRKNKLQRNQMLGIGVSVQGSVDKEGAVSVYNHYIKDWSNIPLKSLFEDYFGVPVRVIHDPVCIALAQQAEHSYLHNEDFILIRLGYGIGMSYVHGGRPIHGHQGTAGEGGHMIVRAGGELCSCGNRGCLEAYCSVRGIARRIYEHIVPESERAEKPFVDNDIPHMKEILVPALEKYRQGDKAIRQIFMEASYYLGVGVANLINLLNPRYVILTGGILDEIPPLVEAMKQSAKLHAWHFSTFSIDVCRESRRRASVGAAMSFINDAFEDQNSVLVRKVADQ